MKFQDDISNMNTHIRTSRHQYVPHFFKVGGIKSVALRAVEIVKRKMVGQTVQFRIINHLQGCSIKTWGGGGGERERERERERRQSI